MPIAGFFCSLSVPLPILFYRSKLGRAGGLIIPVISVIVMLAVLGGITADMLFFVELLLLGFVMSELFEKNLSIEKTVLYVCCAVFFAGLVCLVFYGNISQKGIGTLISDYIAKNLDFTLVLYKNMGMPEDDIRKISDALDNIRYVLVRITPAMVISFLLIVTWTNLLMSRPVFRHKGLFYPDFGALNLWKAPEGLVWGAIGCGIALLFPSKAVKILGLNGLIILMTIYFFGGIAIVSFYFEKKQFPLMVRFFLYSLIALQQLILIAVIGLGFFDIWFNFRKLNVGDNSS